MTVPCDEAPPVTFAGFTATVESDAAADGVTVRPDVRETPLAPHTGATGATHT